MIMVEFGPQQLTPESTGTIFSKVFLNQQDRFEELVPSYWKSCVVSASTGGGGTKEYLCRFSEKFLALPGVHFAQASAVPHEVDPSVERVGKSVTAPRAIFTPDPRYSLDARQAGIAGIVILNAIVGADGQPTDIWITRPLGYGLDELAIAAVQSWKFEPAQRAGKPVAVWIAVQVDFHLY